MNPSSPKPDNQNKGGKFDALIVPAADTGDFNFELMHFDQKIPSCDVHQHQPVTQPQSPPPTLNDTAVSFELNPDFTRDRSQRHFDVAPLPLKKVPYETDIHIPVITPSTPAPGAETDSYSHIYRNPAPAAPVPGTPAAQIIPEAIRHLRAENSVPSEFSRETEIGTAAVRPFRATPGNILDHYMPTATPGKLHPAADGQVSNPHFAAPVASPDSISPDYINHQALSSAITKLVHTIPLLTEADLLTSLAEPQNGGFTISLKTLKQSLTRIGLETDYKRYRAYITG